MVLLIGQRARLKDNTLARISESTTITLTYSFSVSLARSVFLFVFACPISLSSSLSHFLFVLCPFLQLVVPFFSLFSLSHLAPLSTIDFKADRKARVDPIQLILFPFYGTRFTPHLLTNTHILTHTHTFLHMRARAKQKGAMGSMSPMLGTRLIAEHVHIWGVEDLNHSCEVGNTVTLRITMLRKGGT